MAPKKVDKLMTLKGVKLITLWRPKGGQTNNSPVAIYIYIHTYIHTHACVCVCVQSSVSRWVSCRWLFSAGLVLDWSCCGRLVYGYGQISSLSFPRTYPSGKFIASLSCWDYVFSKFLVLPIVRRRGRTCTRDPNYIENNLILRHPRQKDIHTNHK